MLCITVGIVVCTRHSEVLLYSRPGNNQTGDNLCQAEEAKTNRYDESKLLCGKALEYDKAT